MVSLEDPGDVLVDASHVAKKVLVDGEQDGDAAAQIELLKEGGRAREQGDRKRGMQTSKRDQVSTVPRRKE